ncbi:MULTISPECIES: type I toxin-antitoxin system Fst family toxin [unclassified Staphylococcus]|nr:MULTISPECIES: type I toxin-antitoxin system Fst family toxin [unclassified Staphylococcus]UXR74034.1 type I toxin-antitoxin system Fst family toxin [Staphylococcus sp. IVB6238]UXR76422.1 type I toxin-antitoxin system Fst family toxin [Staphylococcus sp. IVB6233]UXR80549.1 type I toxin-antitoxin system Fst family toxin [Staphylococcus sp. IVB6218]
MNEMFIHFTTTLISGCIVAMFAHWLRKHDDENRR